MTLDLKKLDPAGQAYLVERAARVNPVYFATEYMVGPPQEPFFGKTFIGPHHEEWARQIVKHKKFCNLAYRGSGKTYMFSCILPIWTAWNHPDERTVCFAPEERRGKEVLTDIKKALERSSKLRHLIPPLNVRGTKWTETGIRLTNGHEIDVVGWDQATRGRHPVLIVVDDVLTDKAMRSEQQREYLIKYFFEAVSGMAIPRTRIAVIGTPLAADDLLAQLQDNSEYVSDVFPAVRLIAEGQLGFGALRTPEHPLAGYEPFWPEVHSLEFFESIYRERGQLVFSQEYLCVPSSGLSSLYPTELLKNDDQLMMDVGFGHTRQWWHDNFGITSVFAGVDLAVSANIKADYFVVFVIGLDDDQNHFVLDIIREHGLPFNEQIAIIDRINAQYRPEQVFAEQNGFQAVLTQEVKRTTDTKITGFQTGMNKHSLYKGVPSMRVLHENKKYRIPYGDPVTKDLVDRWMLEMTGFSYKGGKVISVAKHDDVAMANYFAEQAVGDSGFSFAFVGNNDQDLIEKAAQTRQSQAGNPPAPMGSATGQLPPGSISGPDFSTAAVESIGFGTTSQNQAGKTKEMSSEMKQVLGLHMPWMLNRR